MTVGQALERFHAIACDGIEHGAPDAEIMDVLREPFPQWSRDDLIKFAVAARFFYDRTIPVRTLLGRMRNMRDYSDEKLGMAASGYVLAGAYYKLGRFGEWQAKAAAFGLKVECTPDVQPIESIDEIPAGTPLMFAVMRCADAKNPVQGSRVIHCDDCNEQCWLSPATGNEFMKAATQGRNPMVFCAHCLIKGDEKK